MIFHKHDQTILFFCRVWIRLIDLHLLLYGKCDKSVHLPEFDACPMHSALGPRVDASKFSVRVLDLSHFTRKNKCAFINL